MTFSQFFGWPSSIFLHGCEIKSGSGLGTRLVKEVTRLLLSLVEQGVAAQD